MENTPQNKQERITGLEVKVALIRQRLEEIVTKTEKLKASLGELFDKKYSHVMYMLDIKNPNEIFRPIDINREYFRVFTSTYNNEINRLRNEEDTEISTQLEDSLNDSVVLDNLKIDLTTHVLDGVEKSK
jgi:hypothetical protein